MLRTLWVMALLFVAGCITSRPVAVLDSAASCNEIVHPALLVVPFADLSQGQSQTEIWIVTTFPTSTVTYEPSVSTYPGSVGQFYWFLEEMRFSLVQEANFQHITQLSEQHPTLGQILHCYGAPNYYTLEKDTPLGGESIGSRLELWYTEQGLILEYARHGSDSEAGYDNNSIMVGRVIVTPPGSVEEMIRNQGSLPETYIDRKLALTKGWPENLAELGRDE